MTTSWHGAAVTATGGIGLAMARIQAAPMSSTLSPHADRIDLRRRRERADHDGHVVAPALGVDHVGEQEGAPRALGDAAEELPAHQRVQLGVLVDGAVDAHQQAARFEIGEMGLEVERGPARLVLPDRIVSGFVEHGVCRIACDLIRLRPGDDL